MKEGQFLPIPLFRQEVIDFQQNERQFGQIGLLKPLSITIMTWSIASFVSTWDFFTFGQSIFAKGECRRLLKNINWNSKNICFTTRDNNKC